MLPVCETGQMPHVMWHVLVDSILLPAFVPPLQKSASNHRNLGMGLVPVLDPRLWVSDVGLAAQAIN